ncbi:hypothetical protein E4U54_007716 [Claviceps lovelessii]|nr:hypothetical protein E4U54_007716 [Claviceps lovelessii]
MDASRGLSDDTYCSSCLAPAAWPQLPGPSAGALGTVNLGAGVEDRRSFHFSPRAARLCPCLNSGEAKAPGVVIGSASRLWIGKLVDDAGSV